MSSAIRRQLSGVGLSRLPSPPDAGQDRGDQLLADRVERRVGHLREELLEVVEQRLRAVGEDGQRGVGPHRAERLLAVVAHRAEDELEVFQRVAEGLLAVQQRLVVRAGDVRAPRGPRPAAPSYSRSHLPYGLAVAIECFSSSSSTIRPCSRSTRNILPGSSRPLRTTFSGGIVEHADLGGHDHAGRPW